MSVSSSDFKHSVITLSTVANIKSMKDFPKKSLVVKNT